MKLLKIVYTPILILLSIFAYNCSSHIAIECNTLNTDSTYYFVSGMMDHHEWDKGWIKEEIKKDDVNNWLRSYDVKLLDDTTIKDTLTITKIISKEFSSYLIRWDKVKDKIKNDYKIYYYSTPDVYWKSLSGQDGLVIINNCKVLYIFILSQS
jgi:hypothetical protein